VTTPTLLMEDLARRGVQLSARAGRLVVDAPAGALTVADRDALRANKAAILGRLAVAPPGPTPPAGATPDVGPTAEIPPCPACVRPWACRNAACPDPSRWWRAPGYIIRCRGCEPPAFPAWVVEEGDRAAAPLVVELVGRPGSTQSERPTTRRDRRPTRLRVWRPEADLRELRPLARADRDRATRCARCGAVLEGESHDGFCADCTRDEPD
jgi:hypothetical protein